MLFPGRLRHLRPATDDGVHPSTAAAPKCGVNEDFAAAVSPGAGRTATTWLTTRPPLSGGFSAAFARATEGIS